MMMALHVPVPPPPSPSSSRAGQPRSPSEGGPRAGAPAAREEQTDAGAADEPLGQVGELYTQHKMYSFRSYSVTGQSALEILARD